MSPASTRMSVWSKRSHRPIAVIEFKSGPATACSVCAPGVGAATGPSSISTFILRIAEPTESDRGGN
jgi:hypothetical protein